MSFIKKNADVTPIVDTVFSVVALAKEAKKTFGKEQVIDATIGSLCDEAGELVALRSVFDSYDALSPRIKAAYAASFIGNSSYREQVAKWVLQTTQCTLPHSVVATPGGTGAISMCFTNLLDEGETVILPQIAWGSYELMAQENHLQVQRYELFDGEQFHMRSFKEICQSVMGRQHKVMVILNDPCHNPTGYSLTYAEWQEIISFLNELSKQGECIIVNDIAYIDYSYQLDSVRSYMNLFNTLSNHVMAVICFSCSKSLTSYGLRLGAAMIAAQRKEAVREVEVLFEKTARSVWSNAANAAMENFVAVTSEHKEAYMQEKAYYIDLMKRRSDLFMAQAKQYGLQLYPYREGFFITLKMPSNAVRDAYHQALCDNQIYTVKVNLGIRIAICSISVKQSDGLAKRMLDVREGLQ